MAKKKSHNPDEEFFEEITAEASLPIDGPAVEEISPSEPVGTKSYDLRKNGKELNKTDIPYVYSMADGSGYVYRLYHKAAKMDKWVFKDPETQGKTDRAGKKIPPQPFRTKQKAHEHMLRQLEALNKDDSYKYRNITFGEVWEMYKASDNGRANETIRRYDSIYKHHCEKEFGGRAIGSIPAEDYNQFFVRLHRVGDGNGSKKNGYSFAFVESILKFIYLVVHHAYAKHFISTDAIVRFDDELKMPDKKKASDIKKIRVLSDEQIVKVKELLEGTDYYLPFLLSLTAGLRPAETFALCFEDFDYSNCTVTVNKQIAEEASGKRVIKQPKTTGSTRTIELPLFVITEVRKREASLNEARQANPLVFEQNAKRFIDGRNFTEELIEQPNFINVDKKGNYINAHSFSYYTKLIKRDICPAEEGVEDFSFYTFRKTHLSNMAANNCPVGELMKRAGHTKIEMHPIC